MNKNPKNAYTLIEIMTVVSIISFLSVIFLANYKLGEKQLALRRATYKLAQDIRGVQRMAMSARKFNDTFPGGGYGIYFLNNSGSYIIFADCDNDVEYDAAGSAPSCEEATTLNPYPEKIEEIFLEKETTITSLNPSFENSLSITFYPPEPLMKINPDTNVSSIDLSLEGRSSRVIAGKPGLVDIDLGQ